MLAITPMWWIMWGVFLASATMPATMRAGIGLIVLAAGLLAPGPPSSDTRGKRERGADGRWERRCRLVCPSLQDGPAAVRSRSCAVSAAAWFALRRR